MADTYGVSHARLEQDALATDAASRGLRQGARMGSALVVEYSHFKDNT